MPKQLTNSKPTKVKLSDTQLIMMREAARREDRCLVAPGNLKGGAARKVAEKLIAAGLVKEIRAKPGMPAWRRDEEAARSYALKLTTAALKAVAVEKEDADKAAAKGSSAGSGVGAINTMAPVIGANAVCGAVSNEAATPVAAATDHGAAFELGPPLPATAPPRPGSKLSEVVEMLGRDKGASIEELIAATDWLPHTTRAALTGLRKRGYSIEWRREDKSTRYRLVPAMINDASAADGTGEAEGCKRAKRSCGAERSKGLERCNRFEGSASVAATAPPVGAAR